MFTTTRFALLSLTALFACNSTNITTIEPAPSKPPCQVAMDSVRVAEGAPVSILSGIVEGTAWYTWQYPNAYVVQFIAIRPCRVSKAQVMP